MKNLILLALVSLFAIPTMAGDVLFLLKEDGSVNQMFDVKVTKIKKCKVLFKMEGEKFAIASSEKFLIKFEDPSNRELKKYDELSSYEKCNMGIMDANMYHKNGAAFGWGVLFGPFAMIGAAISNPSPMNSSNAYVSPNRDLFSDASYLSCYSTQARKKNVKGAGLGWLSWILLVIVLSSAAGA